MRSACAVGSADHDPPFLTKKKTSPQPSSALKPQEGKRHADVVGSMGSPPCSVIERPRAEEGSVVRPSLHCIVFAVPLCLHLSPACVPLFLWLGVCVLFLSTFLCYQQNFSIDLTSTKSPGLTTKKTSCVCCFFFFSFALFKLTFCFFTLYLTFCIF